MFRINGSCRWNSFGIPSPRVQHELGTCCFRPAGRYDEAAAHCGEEPAEIKCKCRARIGHESTRHYVSSREFPKQRFCGHTLGRAGRREEGENFTLTTARNPFQQAPICAGLGDKDRKSEALDRMTVQEPVLMGTSRDGIDAGSYREYIDLTFDTIALRLRSVGLAESTVGVIRAFRCRYSVVRVFNI